MNESPTDRSAAQPTDDVLQRAIDAMNNSPEPGPSPALMTATLAALQAHDPPTPANRSSLLRKLPMKSLTATAGLLLVAVAALLIVPVFQSSSLAFTNAVEQLRTARTLSYTSLISVKDSPAPIKTKEFFAEDGRHRSEHETGVTSIFDASSMIRLTLIELTKTALVGPPVDEKQPLPPHRFQDWLETLKKLGDQPDEKLGEKTIDGHRAVGFIATQGRRTFTIWVDVKTNELVRVKYDLPIDGPVKYVVMTDFRFNEPLDESLFSFDVPEGYRVQRGWPRINVPGGEKSIIEALRGYTKLSDGQLPDSLSDWGAWAVVLSKNNDNGRPSKEANRLSTHLGSILPFLTGMSQDDYEYLGKGKSTADADAIIFWHKTKDGAYRAIYGDLQAKDVTAADLPLESRGL